MIKNIALLVTTYLVVISCKITKKEDYIIKLIQEKYDEIGVRSGYVNQDGDTIIPLGKYYYCYTDTFRNFAIVYTKDGKIIGIDRKEQELFEIFKYENGPDYLEDGLFRIIKNGKIGFANEQGCIIIEPQFDCAFPFKNDKAKVSNNCKSINEHENSSWISNQWKFINKKGEEVIE